MASSSCLRLPSTGTTPPPSPSSSHCSSRGTTRTHRIECRSSFLGSRPTSLYRSRSLEIGIEERKGNNKQTLWRAASADLQVFDEDDEFMKRLQELALGGNPRNPKRKDYSIEAMTESVPVPSTSSSHSGPTSPGTTNRQPWQVSGFGPSISIPQGGIHNSCDMPASLRLIKQKKKRRKQTAAGGWEDGFREVGESACSSVNNAFSSMVFMIRELQSFTLHMRQGLFYEDLQDILGRVQQDMHASFVWLFQQIFSGTPTLMVSIMLLLANFTVYSMTDSVAVAAPLSQPQIGVVAVVESSTSEQKSINQMQFDHAPAVKSFSSGRAASVGGSGSGGGKVRPVAGATDDSQSEGPSSSLRIARGAVEAVGEEDEEAAWSHMVEEAKQMQVGFMDPAVLKWMANPPVTVTVENDGYTDYKRTELDYQLAVQDDPQNSLLLTNFALFLQLVLHDNERAEYYFKKAVAVEPADGDAFSKYANFLWVVKNDTEAAEEKYLEALMADPGNSFHAASYAHFLWNTGGEDTCFPDYA